MMMRVYALLLAAGASTRMGRPKALLPWGGRTLVEFQVEQLVEGGVARVLLVLGHQAEAIDRIAASLPRTEIVVNPDWSTGKTSSVRAGMRALPEDADAVLVLSVDQPTPASLIRQALHAHVTGNALITVPAFRGRPGHPAIFAKALFQEMLDIAEETEGLRAVRRRHVAGTHTFDAPTALFDLNTPEDYEAALQYFCGKPTCP